MKQQFEPTCLLSVCLLFLNPSKDGSMQPLQGHVRSGPMYAGSLPTALRRLLGVTPGVSRLALFDVGVTCNKMS